ncbi:S1 family peptidase [Virgibacillus sp. LDC1]|uniref:hypothetical protein n=1 Tax=Paenibacillus TaxID=44249 RepID=UPI0002071E01|nr:hypothetical protein [Paenibacillus sp. HGF5]EGG37956.1 hypothetical protein HMPREF9412_5117 [Paenibacillus sp. HGF5]MCV4232475.1 S1 family peptidase [Virgibacillus sp. LDC1]
MKRKLSSFIIIVSSFFLITGTAFSETKQVSVSSNLESNERGEIKVDLGPAPPNAIKSVIPFEESNPEKTKRDEDHGEISIYLQTNYSDIYGGTYTSIEGQKYFLLTEVTPEIELEIRKLSDFPDTFEIKQVQYSEKQLEAVKNSLSQSAKAFDLQGVGLDIENNRVLAITTTQPNKANEAAILKEGNSDIIHWKVNEEKAVYEPLAYNMYPGEQIDMQSTASTNFCSLSFNGRANLKDVGVTAGHCGNRTWYDVSDGSSSIGKMSNAVFSDNSLFDAGFIEYVSGVNPSYYLNGNTMTIGTTDYSGIHREVGDYVYIHAVSGVGNSYGSLRITITNYDLIGGPTDMVLTQNNSSLLPGDSGALVYSLAHNGTKNYARIEGVFGGRYQETPTSTKYLTFSKYSRVFDGLGMSGVYTDPSY